MNDFLKKLRSLSKVLKILLFCVQWVLQDFIQTYHMMKVCLLSKKVTFPKRKKNHLRYCH